MNVSNLIKKKKYEYLSPSNGKWVEVIFQKENNNVYTFNVNNSPDMIMFLTTSSVSEYIREIKL